MHLLKPIYEQQLKLRGYQSDPAQLAAVALLDECAMQWANYKQRRSNALKKLLNPIPVPRGVYMHGGVGRGKSFLMDCFFDVVPIQRKTRLHFHEFMREVHQQLRALQGTVNPLDVLGAQIAKKYKLICFDEFHVANITDAMILHRLLDALFANGVGMVMTSNFEPDALYPDGLHRERILPAIDLLKRHMQVVSVDNGTDYRKQTLAQIHVYHWPLDTRSQASMQAVWEQLKSPSNDAQEQAENKSLTIEGRTLPTIRASHDVVWFEFKTLCDGPRSQNDYLELSQRYHTVMVSNVPKMGVAMASAARRFTWLVDVFYDRKVKLILSCAVPPEELYTEGPLAHEFVRTVSRLTEMQSQEYLSADRRDVDTVLAG